ncbi:NAD(P)-binding protein [Stipitochalara longipes BDJ]|nr:NAD(P)-binding protein [Stipitochalara longipes BDJ]
MPTTSLPTNMKGVIIERTGGVEVLQYKTDLPVPACKEGEVLIKNDYVGVNFRDINFRSGLYPAPKPYILGCEGEGTVVSIGFSDSTNMLQLGDHVVWLNPSNGGYAEYSVCPISKVARIPRDLEPGVAVACLSQGLTALTFIQKAYCVQEGEWILVQGATGGVGSWLCRLLSLVGARVIGTVRTAKNARRATGNGVKFALDAKDNDVVAKVMEITSGEGVAAVFDGVGKATFDQGLQALARDGTMASYGNTSGNVTDFNIDRLRERNLRLMRPSVFGYVRTREEFVGFAEKLFEFMRSAEDHGMGEVERVIPLEEVKTAHDELEARKISGRLLLKI